MLKLLIWDWEGTLVDSFQGAFFSLQSLIKKNNLNPEFEYKDILNNSDAILKKYNISVDQWRIENEKLDPWLVPVAWYIIDAMYKKNIIQTIVSNGSFQLINKHLKKFQKARYFREVIGLNLGFPLKPDPAMVNFILSKLKIKPEEALLIGDSEIDMQCSDRAGCSSFNIIDENSFNELINILEI